MKDVIFFDIDGTLYDNSICGLRESTKDILLKLSLRKDTDLYISTGRSMDALSTLNDIIHIFKGFNLVNGEHIIIDNKTIYTNKIPNTELQKLYKTCIDNNISAGYMSTEGTFLAFKDSKSQNDFDTYVGIKATHITEFKEIKGDVLQVWLFATNEVINSIKEEFALTFLNWGTYGADVIAKGKNKGEGIKKIIQLNHYDLAHTFAFGDSFNDISMFKAVNTSICMGNALDEVKKHATYVTDHISNDGLKKAIEKYILVNS